MDDKDQKKDELREQLNAFLEKHRDFYEQMIRIMADCVERDDVKEISWHITHMEKVIQQTLNLRLMMQRQEKVLGGTA